LLPEYRSDANDVVREFYEPCLERCQLYRRAVGYFTSSGLAAAARGITHFIAGNGTMQLVASPAIEPEDQDAIKRGYDARKDIIAKSLLRELAKAEDAAARDRLGYLAWLIAEERLEIQLALPVTPNGEFRNGIYHEKLGIFEDTAEDRVAFSGSANETAGGLVDNFESIDVFWSWEDHQGRVARKLANFERLWKNQTSGVDIYEFPDAAKKQLLKLKPGSRPGPTPPPPASKKWRHQDEAVAKFLEKERGVLDMATGTGKTHTALRIAERLWASGAIDTLIVATEGTDLLDQWYLNLLQVRGSLTGKPAILRHYSTHKDRDKYQLNPHNRMLLASREALAPALKTLPPAQAHKTLLVHDEVHGLGSPGNRLSLAGLSDAIRFRLGLSATWEREYDAEGTAFITAHIGPVIFQFGLDHAIRRGILAPFNYHPITYVPNDEDRARLKKVYQMAVAKKKAGEPMSPEQVHMELARVHKTSKAKLAPFKAFIAEHPDLLQRCIIFVETREYGDHVLKIVHGHHHDFHTYYAAEDAEILRQFAAGEIECLITCHKLSEGIDIRSLESVILFSSARTQLETIQRIGRCLRTDPANPTKRANVVDFIRTQDDSEDEGDKPPPPPNADQQRQAWLAQLAAIVPEDSQ
jgi:superfamily II DNA or RNA helicase